MNFNLNEASERREIALDAVAAVLSMPYSVVSQKSRREKLGLVDAVRPTYCSDFRRRFVTVESVKQVLQNRALMRGQIIIQK